jgi:hypothetical protein
MTKSYPAIIFITQHGRKLAVALAAALLLASCTAWLLTRSPIGLIIGLPVAAAAWGLMRLAAEVIEVVAETLLPR